MKNNKMFNFKSRGTLGNISSIQNIKSFASIAELNSLEDEPSIIKYNTPLKTFKS